MSVTCCLAAGLTLYVAQHHLRVHAFLGTMTPLPLTLLVFYLPPAGVAPRAKMNQQRSRRFRAADDRKKVCAPSSPRMFVAKEEKLARQRANTTSTCAGILKPQTASQYMTACASPVHHARVACAAWPVLTHTPSLLAYCLLLYIQAEDEKRKKGEDVPNDAFDSNCITPGTPFMGRLGAHLRFFIRKRIAEDANWQKCTVVFSGASTKLPGTLGKLGDQSPLHGACQL